MGGPTGLGALLVRLVLAAIVNYEDFTNHPFAAQ